MGGGTEVEGSQAKDIEIIENEGFRNANLLFLADGGYPVDKAFVNDFKGKRVALP